MRKILFLIPFLLFCNTDITEYKDKIKPDKEYEIVGQDILDVINTIDSLKNKVDSLFNIEGEQVFVNSVDTVYVPLSLNKMDTIYSTVYDTIYISQIVNKDTIYEDYIFYIIFGLLMCFAVWLKLKNSRKNER